MKYVLMFTSDPAQLANVSEEDTQAVYGKAVSYTHLTLPTKRIV